MLNFVKAAFRELCEILLWLFIIGCTIAGYVIGSAASSDKAVVGGIIGLVGGLVISILYGGFIATIIEIGHNLTIIKEAIAKTTTPAMSVSPITVPCAPIAMSDVPADSVLIKSGQTLSGVIRHNNDRNLFHVVLAQSSKLSMKVTRNDENGLPHWDSYINVLGANNKKISTSGRFEFPYIDEVDLPTAGTYVIEITSPKTGRYNLTVQY